MLLAFDLDKTIVRNDYQLPQEIADAIHAVREAGHLVSILTGRPHMAMTDFLEQLGVTEYYSANHGAFVVGQAGKVIHHQRLEPHDLRSILSQNGQTDEVEFSAIVDDTLYVKTPGDPRWDWAHTLNRRVEQYHEGLELYADKIVFASNGKTDLLQTSITKSHPDFVQYPWEDGHLEITSTKADKGFALAMIAALRGVEQKDTVAFGDGLNDLTMLEWAGHGVAVGPQAHNKVIAIADEHIASPEELGVKHWLEKHVL